jgi:hypothetical protein
MTVMLSVLADGEETSPHVKFWGEKLCQKIGTTQGHNEI